jgi:prepilin-type N-terminal cleavage/methylation domain-containing protein/prepilin-type processing-associated H-X9-DG protein
VQGFRRPGGDAFTLVEMMMVIAVMAILAALLIPALNNGRERGKAVYCLNNFRQLGLALHGYATDHEDVLPGNMGKEGIQQTVARGEFANWANNVMSWELDSDNTNSVLQANTGLGREAGNSWKIFKCPSDRALSDVQKSAGWRERVRSVSMNAMVGNAGEFMSSGVNTNNPNYVQFTRLGDVPDPSRIFTFIEEHPDSINDGYFLNRFNSFQWIDLPASYHNRGANLAYADGHAEWHRWKSRLTAPAASPDAAKLPMYIPSGQRADFYWLMSQTSVYATPPPEHSY